MRRYEIKLTFVDDLGQFLANASGMAEVSDPRKTEQNVVDDFASDVLRQHRYLRTVCGVRWNAHMRQL